MIHNDLKILFGILNRDLFSPACESERQCRIRFKSQLGHCVDLRSVLLFIAAQTNPQMWWHKTDHPKLSAYHDFYGQESWKSLAGQFWARGCLTLFQTGGGLSGVWGWEGAGTGG